MPISHERLVARKEELLTQLETLKQQYNAVVGALADVEFWLNEVGLSSEKPDSKE